MHLLRWLKFKRLTKPSVSKDVEKLERYATEGDVKWHNHFGKPVDSTDLPL